jgi:uncharacterized protein
MSAPGSFAEFALKRYLSLETFRRNGTGVRTPVWFAEEIPISHTTAPARLYVYTIGNSGKVKRIRNNPRVRIAPCSRRGKITGNWTDARAEILSGVEEDHGMRLLNRKYVPWKQLLDFFASFRTRQRIVFAITPS